MKEKFLIRCRETGLFYHPGIAGPWTDQANARRLDRTNAEWYAEYLAETRHCVHIVPEGWTPAAERDPLKVRIRNFFVSIYHFFFLNINMRWIYKPLYTMLQEGDHRRCTKFLWWPRRIKYETRWLEWASWLEVYQHDGYDQNWVPLSWD